MKTEKLMTEKQFIAKFKKEGFELYQTKTLRPKLKALGKIDELIKLLSKIKK